MVHSLAVAYDGALYSFGCGMYGKLSHGDEEDLTPVGADGGGGAGGHAAVRSAAAGENHSVVLTEAGGVHTFGYNGNGELGHTYSEMGEKGIAPTAVEALAGEEVVAGGYHTLVRLASGELLACGDNKHGQLGTGEEDGEELRPARCSW